MKIKELLKYSILPLFIVLIYTISFLTEKLDVHPSDEMSVVLILLGGLFFIGYIILLLLLFFTFFKDAQIPIIMFSVAIFLNSLLTIILTKANTPFSLSVSEDSEMLTLILLFCLAFGYFVTAIRFFLRVKGNRFLLFILIIGGLVFTFNFIYFGLILADSEMGKGVLMTLSIGLFLLFSFIVIFSLPNSDYMEWKKDHKQLFLKSILIPWSLILFLSFMNFIVNPNQAVTKEKKSTTPAFSMEKYEIKPKDGME